MLGEIYVRGLLLPQRPARGYFPFRRAVGAAHLPDRRRRRDPFGAALFFWLFGFSVSELGVYMFDAFDRKMTLLDGHTGAESASAYFLDSLYSDTDSLIIGVGIQSVLQNFTTSWSLIKISEVIECL